MSLQTNEKRYRLGFIGGGKLAGSVMRGLARAGVCAASEMLVSEPNEAARTELSLDLAGIGLTGENGEVAEKAEVILLGVKPGVVLAVIAGLGKALDDIAGAETLYGNGPDYLDSIDGPVLKNIATRALIGTGDKVLIGGFIVQGSEPATVILRAIGPSLAEVGLAGELVDPTITVYDASQRQIATNDDWFTSADAETIASYNLDPHNSRESAVYLTLQPGAYTAVVESFSSADTPPSSGVGLVELYDLHTSAGRAGNISTRAQVLNGDNVLIGGLIVGGAENKTVIIRAIGPSLSANGIAGPLADPLLELHDSTGAIVETNDNWQQSPDSKAITDAGLAPTNAKESALEATVAPGAYTAIVRGVNGVTGIAVVEVYDISPASGM